MRKNVKVSMQKKEMNISANQSNLQVNRTQFGLQYLQILVHLGPKLYVLDLDRYQNSHGQNHGCLFEETWIQLKWFILFGHLQAFKRKSLPVLVRISVMDMFLVKSFAFTMSARPCDERFQISKLIGRCP